MERRREPRQIEELPVRIRGVDEHGRSFDESVCAHNISQSGALLVGIDRKLRCGDLIVVQFGLLKARFRIVWVRDSQAAVQRLKQDECPWPEILAGPHADTAAGKVRS